MKIQDNKKEQYYVNLIKSFLDQYNISYQKQGSGMFSMSGLPDIIGSVKTQGFVVEVKKWKKSYGLKDLQKFWLLKYKNEGFLSFVVSNEESFNHFKTRILSFL